MPEHCQIVGEVARALIARIPLALRPIFPVNAPFAAACHDIGKVSPTFVEKLRRYFTKPVTWLPALPINPDLERQWGGHAGISQVTAKALHAPQWVPEILGQHHGFSPSIAGKRADAELFGGLAWLQERSALVDELKQRLGMDWPQISSPEQARLVAGLTSVADWIGSGQHFEDPSQPWQNNIERALDEAGFIPPVYQQSLSFAEVFGFAPRAVQNQLIEVVKEPGVYVLEAPMGLGKTEAALYAAYQALQSGQACGIYFALPTQLTSNKIYQRFNYFLERILAPSCLHRHALLLHGKAWLQTMEMGEEGRPGGAWFDRAKRGLLAPFAVGTIDQALMAAMNVKHGFVRAFGLAGKVVILDEVHSYDVYTGTLLDALVELLRSLHCTVIILSATLNQERRSQLLKTQLTSNAYPLITAASTGQAVHELAVGPPADTRVNIILLQDEAKAVQAALDRAAQGQQILWIENTVNEAQQRYLDLAARARELGLDCGLLHSRFTAIDRQTIEDHWVDLFGKPGWPIRNQQGRILVGTQVLEQSLDIDADFLVSRFAPTDMLLQRMGRLWRHADTPRAAGAICEAWLLAPDLASATESPISSFGASAFVYAPYVLCRSLEVWQSIQQLVLPGDIRRLIEASYASRDEQGQMVRWLYELDHGTQGRNARKGRIALQQLARIGLAQDGKTLPESQAQTRYSENDSHEVLLLRCLFYDEISQTTRLTSLDRKILELPTQRHKLTKPQWKALTAYLMQQLVPVRAQDAPLAPSRELLEKLGFHHCFYLGDRNWADDESLLRLALVDETGRLQGLYGASTHDRHTLEYRDELGYRVVKN
ncbi:CRISPR-associated helicase Cas3' [Nitrosomonas eutropha]|uniref:CRISPR-associated helicase Cas3' n=1 Tax=Nitrosomonas eutropha TaxID=916 RepID=UPI001C409778